MNSRERVLAHLAWEPVERLPVMPITMQFACDIIGANYHKYETDHRALVAGQMRVAEQFDFDYVNTMSNPAREASDCRATVKFFENEPAALVKEQALLSDKTKLATLKSPDRLGGGPQIYEEFVWPYEKLIDGVHALGARPRLHVCGNTRFALEDIGKLGREVVDLHSLAPMAEARAKMGANQILIGNINPVTVLRGGRPDEVPSAVAECHRQAGSRFIGGAGCEVPSDTPHENVRALSEYARGAVMGRLS